MTVIIRYSQIGRDCRIPSLIAKRAKLKKTTYSHLIHFVVNDYEEAVEIIDEISLFSSYGIEVVKIGTFGDKIKSLFKKA